MISSNPSNAAVFPLKSPTHFAWLLGVSINELEEVAEKADSFYNPFINKKGRNIDNPRHKLKIIQGKINQRILTQYTFPDFITGGVKGKKIQDHLSIHVQRPVVITLDVKNCFPNISNSMVYKVWRGPMGCYPDTARLATRLTTFKGHVPLGSATSNLIVALTLLPCLEKVRCLAEKHGFCMRQFVDDTALSGVNLKDDLITEICKEFSRHGFIIKRQKVRVMRSNKPQLVTKMLVNRKMGKPRAERNKVRAALKQLELMGSSHPDFNAAYSKVRGRITYLKSFHQKSAEQMVKRLEKIK
jgi:RNA-directed DNA polymerase